MFLYFKSVFQLEGDIPTICNETDIKYVHVDSDSSAFLNSPFTEEEVKSTIERLKGKKSPGPDYILNEMLASAVHVITPLVTRIFNHIFLAGIFPSEWSKAYIIPVYKKGDKNECCNYRPISLTSLLSKVYTSTLNKRLTLYSDLVGILPEEQAGFREGYSTIDHVFSLYAMIFKQFSKNQKLYAAFIDYRRCFDSINKDALFIILERNGIDGCFLNTIKSIYKSVFAAVRNNSEISDYFECPVGLRQGCLLSPRLFTIFVTEVSKHINVEGKHGIQLLTGLEIIHHLLYADDNVLLSDTPIGLQSKLNILHTQSKRLGLEVNLDKTKIIVFRKGGFLGKFEKWNYDGVPIEVVNSYTYLGVEFSTKMSFVNCTLPLISKASKACYEILRSLNALSCCNLNVFLKLFDAKVQPILSYGSELWGMSDIEEVERMHTKALKRFLNVSIHCSNASVYGETGRYPLSINHKVNSLRYWLRLLKMPNTRICKQAYDMLVKLSESGSRNWVSDIRNLLCLNGFGIAWMFKQVGNEKMFLGLVKERLRDCYVQGWFSKIKNSKHLECYSGFKSMFQSETYLNNSYLIKSHRNVIIRFRCGVSDINVHRYKFSHNANSFMCPFCKNEKEDEFHVLFVCPVYERLRTLYIPLNFRSRPSVLFMNMLMASNSHGLAKYLSSLFSHRKELLASSA